MLRSWNRSAWALSIVVCLASMSSAQTQDVVGSTTNRSQRGGIAKGNSFRIDTTVILDSFDMWLDFTGPQAVDYYVYRCPSEAGTYVQLLQTTVQLAGTGPGWYSSGSLQFPLICGGHYVLAISFPGTLAYYYGVGNSQAVSFGEHTFAHATGTHPLPASFTTASNDQAIYHMRTWTVLPGATDPDVSCIGVSCATSTSSAPELGVAQLPRLGSNGFELLLSGSTPALLGVAMVTPGLLPFGVPIAGPCELYVDPTLSFILIGPLNLNASGAANFAAPIPQDPSLRGARLGAQSFVIDVTTGALDTTNALALRLN